MPLFLTGTSDQVRVTTDASADIEAHADWAENVSGVITPDRNNPASITSATTTPLVGSPAAGRQRNVRGITLRNNHGSTSCNVTVDHTDGTNANTIIKVNLLAGESLIMDGIGKWTHFDTNGGEYPVTLPAATQAEMEAGTSLVKSVTPGSQHWHPSACKFWAKCGVSGATDAAYNVSSLTDGGAGLMTVNIGTDFSSANWAYFYGIENLDASIDATTDKQTVMLGLAGQAAGTLALICGNETGTAAADPTKWSAGGFGDHA